MGANTPNRQDTLLFAHHLMIVECGLQAFFTASDDDFLSGQRKLGADDVSIYVFPPGNCYFLGIRENLIVEIPEESFDHLVSTGAIFLCHSKPESYLLRHALVVRLPKEKLIEARGAYAAHRSTLEDPRGASNLSS